MKIGMRSKVFSLFVIALFVIEIFAFSSFTSAAQFGAGRQSVNTGRAIYTGGVIAGDTPDYGSLIKPAANPSNSEIPTEGGSLSGEENPPAAQENKGVENAGNNCGDNSDCGTGEECNSETGKCEKTTQTELPVDNKKNDNGLPAKVENKKTETRNADCRESGCANGAECNSETGKCSINAGKIITNQDGKKVFVPEEKLAPGETADSYVDESGRIREGSLYGPIVGNYDNTDGTSTITGKSSQPGKIELDENGKEIFVPEGDMAIGEKPTAYLDQDGNLHSGGLNGKVQGKVDENGNYESTQTGIIRDIIGGLHDEGITDANEVGSMIDNLLKDTVDKLNKDKIDPTDKSAVQKAVSDVLDGYSLDDKDKKIADKVTELIQSNIQEKKTDPGVIRAVQPSDLTGKMNKVLANVFGTDNYLGVRNNDFFNKLLGSPFNPPPKDVMLDLPLEVRMQYSGVVGMLLGEASMVQKPFENNENDNILTKAGKGVVNWGVEFTTSALLSPIGLASAGGSLPGKAGQALSGVFGIDMVQGTVEGAIAAVDAIKKGDIQGAIEAGLGAVSSGYFAVGSAKHVFGIEPTLAARQKAVEADIADINLRLDEAKVNGRDPAYIEDLTKQVAESRQNLEGIQKIAAEQKAAANANKPSASPEAQVARPGFVENIMNGIKNTPNILPGAPEPVSVLANSPTPGRVGNEPARNSKSATNGPVIDRTGKTSVKQTVIPNEPIDNTIAPRETTTETPAAEVRAPVVPNEPTEVTIGGIPPEQSGKLQDQAMMKPVTREPVSPSEIPATKPKTVPDTPIEKKVRDNAENMANANQKRGITNDNPTAAGKAAVNAYNSIPDAVKKVNDLKAQLADATNPKSPNYDTSKAPEIAAELNNAQAELGKKVADAGISGIAGAEKTVSDANSARADANKAIKDYVKTQNPETNVKSSVEPDVPTKIMQPVVTPEQTLKKATDDYNKLKNEFSGKAAAAKTPQDKAKLTKELNKASEAAVAAQAAVDAKAANKPASNPNNGGVQKAVANPSNNGDVRKAVTPADIANKVAADAKANAQPANPAKSIWDAAKNLISNFVGGKTQTGAIGMTPFRNLIDRANGRTGTAVETPSTTSKPVYDAATNTWKSSTDANPNKPIKDVVAGLKADAAKPKVDSVPLPKILEGKLPEGVTFDGVQKGKLVEGTKAPDSYQLSYESPKGKATVNVDIPAGGFKPGELETAIKNKIDAAKARDAANAAPAGDFSGRAPAAVETPSTKMSPSEAAAKINDLQKQSDAAFQKAVENSRNPEAKKTALDEVKRIKDEVANIKKQYPEVADALAKAAKVSPPSEFADSKYNTPSENAAKDELDKRWRYDGPQVKNAAGDKQNSYTDPISGSTFPIDAGQSPSKVLDTLNQKRAEYIDKAVGAKNPDATRLGELIKNIDAQVKSGAITPEEGARMKEPIQNKINEINTPKEVSAPVKSPAARAEIINKNLKLYSVFEGVQAKKATDLANGKQVEAYVEGPLNAQGKPSYTMDNYYKLTTDANGDLVLEGAVYQIFGPNDGKVDASSGLKALKGFEADTLRAAKELGVQKVQIYGVDFSNGQLKGILTGENKAQKGYGFTGSSYDLPKGVDGKMLTYPAVIKEYNAADIANLRGAKKESVASAGEKPAVAEVPPAPAVTPADVANKVAADAKANTQPASTGSRILDAVRKFIPESIKQKVLDFAGVRFAGEGGFGGTAVETPSVSGTKAPTGKVEVKNNANLDIRILCSSGECVSPTYVESLARSLEGQGFKVERLNSDGTPKTTVDVLTSKIIATSPDGKVTEVSSGGTLNGNKPVTTESIVNNLIQGGKIPDSITTTFNPDTPVFKQYQEVAKLMSDKPALLEKLKLDGASPETIRAVEKLPEMKSPEVLPIKDVVNFKGTDWDAQMAPFVDKINNDLAKLPSSGESVPGAAPAGDFSGRAPAAVETPVPAMTPFDRATEAIKNLDEEAFGRAMAEIKSSPTTLIDGVGEAGARAVEAVSPSSAGRDLVAEKIAEQKGEPAAKSIDPTSGYTKEEMDDLFPPVKLPEEAIPDPSNKFQSAEAAKIADKYASLDSALKAVQSGAKKGAPIDTTRLDKVLAQVLSNPENIRAPEKNKIATDVAGALQNIQRQQWTISDADDKLHRVVGAGTPESPLIGMSYDRYDGTFSFGATSASDPTMKYEVENVAAVPAGKNAARAALSTMSEIGNAIKELKGTKYEPKVISYTPALSISSEGVNYGASAQRAGLYYKTLTDAGFVLTDYNSYAEDPFNRPWTWMPKSEQNPNSILSQKEMLSMIKDYKAKKKTLAPTNTVSVTL